MTAGKLRHTLVVRHPETTVATALVAGEPVPAWAKDLVHADDLEDAKSSSEPAKKTTAKKSSSSNDA